MGYLFRQKWHIKGARPRGGAYSCKTMLYPPGERVSFMKMTEMLVVSLRGRIADFSPT